MKATAPAVRLEAVSRDYPVRGGTVRALADVSLEVAPGSSIAIVGPSGCGKSTLLGLIAGLESPSSGLVEIGGRTLSGMTAAERASFRRRQLGLVFQSDNLLPFLTVVENVAFQHELSGLEAGRERCLELLDELGIADQAAKLPDRLSGGQRQRAAVARALVHQPSLILADEPTGSLDSASSDAVVELLTAAVERLGASLVVATHDLDVARRLDRVLPLRDGRIVADSVTAEKAGPVGV